MYCPTFMPFCTEHNTTKSFIEFRSQLWHWMYIASWPCITQLSCIDQQVLVYEGVVAVNIWMLHINRNKIVVHFSINIWTGGLQGAEGELNLPEASRNCAEDRRSSEHGNLSGWCSGLDIGHIVETGGHKGHWWETHSSPFCDPGDHEIWGSLCCLNRKSSPM